MASKDQPKDNHAQHGTHQHYSVPTNMPTETNNANHHHHSRLLYFLTDPSQAMLSLSRLPFNYSQTQTPFLFPAPNLNPPTANKSKPSSSKRPNNPPVILPNPSSPNQPIAVAAVEDCCNQCCPEITADTTKRSLEFDTADTNKRQRTDQATVEKENQPGEGETKCKWSSCVASFDTVEDLTPHLYKNHINNSRKQQQNNICFWESCSDLIEGGDLVHHLTSQHLKNSLLHACRWINCSQRFEAFDTLTIHLSQDHVGCGKSEYSCHWISCERKGKVFTQRQKIMRHIQTHTGAKPFQCSTCQKRFSESNIMIQHMRTHTGEKPYKCDLCDRQFSVSASLTIHKRVHSGEKPFACKYEKCDKRFSESSNLTKHMRVHTGERPFKCTVKPCGKAFSRPDQVTRHLKTHKDVC